MAAYNTRIGRTKQSNIELKNFVKSVNGLYIEYALNQSSNKVPMNWMLSDNALQNICNVCVNKLKDTNDVKLRQQPQMFKLLSYLRK